MISCESWEFERKWCGGKKSGQLPDEPHCKRKTKISVAIENHAPSRASGELKS